MISISDSLKLVNKEKVDILKNCELSIGRYQSEEMNAAEIRSSKNPLTFNKPNKLAFHKGIFKNEVDTNLLNDFQGSIPIKARRYRNGHWGRNFIPLK